MTEPADPVPPLHLVIDGAEDVTPARRSDLPVPAGAGEGGDPGDGRATPMLRAGELPPDCAVTPLGIQGKTVWYLDSKRQLVSLRWRDHSRAELRGLFAAAMGQLREYWPHTRKDGGVDNWRADDVAEALLAVAGRRPVWDVANRVRGLGGWRGGDGGLVLHCGDVILAGGEHHRPGPLGRHVYPAMPPIPRPSDTPALGGGGGPGHVVLDLLRQWHWRRADVDPVLMVGWIGAALAGGALDWRPLAWLTGARATGKSTLHKLIERLFDGALISVSDTSAAGVYQKLGSASLPVAIDELEPGADDRRTAGVIQLARQAASGGGVLRGGAEHSSVEFIIRACFLFSSILVPPLKAQDRSRMAVLDLEPLPGGAIPPDLDERHLAMVGGLLRRRLIDQWPRFDRTLEIFRTGLATGGLEGRAADLYATLLACADVLCEDEPPSPADAAQWGPVLAAETADERGSDDHDDLLDHVRSYVADVFRGGHKQTVGQLVAEAAGRGAGSELGGVNLREDGPNGALGLYGLKVIEERGAFWLAIANKGNGVDALFGGTHWAGRAGASGPHVQAVRRIPGAGAHDPVRIGGAAVRCSVIPLDAVVTAPSAAERAASARGGVPAEEFVE